ncbi:hypothetical protein GUJ93_ZPchr0012g20616 [Zizania palustris]|uniref:Uncharacterized protein n=1 Tax=Zizania palustris TaxID=103762 RepID=A0A8J5WQ41_ZIZPA|nr:hypothetical protein GUJ93_ZPchr0012g20616 [Zizania palustris]
MRSHRLHYLKAGPGHNSQLMESEGSNGKLQESISSHFLKLMLQLLLFDDVRRELAVRVLNDLTDLTTCITLSPRLLARANRGLPLELARPHSLYAPPTPRRYRRRASAAPALDPPRSLYPRKQEFWLIIYES